MDKEIKKLTPQDGSAKDKPDDIAPAVAENTEEDIAEILSELRDTDDEAADNTIFIDDPDVPSSNLEFEGGLITFENTEDGGVNRDESIDDDILGNDEDDSAEDKEAAEEAPVPLFKRVKNAIAAFCENCGFPDMLLARFFGVYLIISGLNVSSYKKLDHSPIDMWKEYIEQTDIKKSLMWLAFGFIMLTILHYFSSKKYRIFDLLAMFGGLLIFDFALMWRTNNFYLSIGVAAVSVVFMHYIVGKTTVSRFEKMPNWVAGAIVLTAATAVGAFVAVTSVSHHKMFSTSCFDFGIFVQMFHSMTSDLTAVTTCERDTFLSHFYVHASFIYYLLAPVYALFPSENTLLIAQAVLAMGGVIPLFLIAKNHNYKGLSLVSVCMVYIFFSGILAPCYYDFHENAFLPTLLMWTLYAMDRRKYILFYIMSILVCIVKEDAPLYVICIAMFLFFNEKSIKRLNGLIVTLISGAYFIMITNWLTKHGDGEMMAATRFGNLTIDPEAGFGGIIKNVLINPSYFFSLFVQEQTLQFFLQVMLPLLFLPFMTKKIERFLLIIPFVIMNLVVGAGYGYAASIGYQYIFGPSCLLIYMLLINCDDFEPEKRNMLVSSAAMVAIIMSVSLLSNNLRYYESYTENEAHYIEMEECLDSVPEEAAVAVDTWYLPHIADRKEVYLFDGGDLMPSLENPEVRVLREIDRYDFFVLAVSGEYFNDTQAQLVANGFTVFNEVDRYMVIYVSPEYAAANNLK